MASNTFLHKRLWDKIVVNASVFKKIYKSLSLKSFINYSVLQS